MPVEDSGRRCAGYTINATECLYILFYVAEWCIVGLRLNMRLMYMCVYHEENIILSWFKGQKQTNTVHTTQTNTFKK